MRHMSHLGLHWRRGREETSEVWSDGSGLDHWRHYSRWSRVGEGHGADSVAELSVVNIVDIITDRCWRRHQWSWIILDWSEVEDHGTIRSRSRSQVKCCDRFS